MSRLAKKAKKGMSSVREHKAHAPTRVACFVVTSSDSRTEATDESGRCIAQLLAKAGHPVVGRLVVKDDPQALRAVLTDRASQAGARAVIISGGTGIGPRDGTHETVARLLEKRLDGFGELFRMLSYEEIGSAAMMSRAIAGTYKGMLLFSIPGSPGSAALAMERLILPELGHALRELTRVP